MTSSDSRLSGGLKGLRAYDSASPDSIGASHAEGAQRMDSTVHLGSSHSHGKARHSVAKNEEEHVRGNAEKSRRRSSGHEKDRGHRRKKSKHRDKGTRGTGHKSRSSSPQRRTPPSSSVIHHGNCADLELGDESPEEVDIRDIHGMSSVVQVAEQPSKSVTPLHVHVSCTTSRSPVFAHDGASVHSHFYYAHVVWCDVLYNEMLIML